MECGDLGAAFLTSDLSRVDFGIGKPMSMKAAPRSPHSKKSFSLSSKAFLLKKKKMALRSDVGGAPPKVGNERASSPELRYSKKTKKYEEKLITVSFCCFDEMVEDAGLAGGMTGVGDDE